MAFKSVKSYNDARYGNMFMLPNDGDYADVIFMYQSSDDVMVCDAHYIKSPDYNGYIQCIGAGCPACAKGIRVQTKLFIPLYNLTTNRLEFWDRTMTIEPQLNNDVFRNYPNPSELVFRITRHGVPRDVNTRYEIAAIAKNKNMSFETICANNHVTFPEFYNTVCKDADSHEISSMLNQDSKPAATNMPEYTATPRQAYQTPTVSTAPAFNAPDTSFSEIVDSGDNVDVPDADEDVDNVNF